MTDGRPIALVKVGGSLLGRADLASLLGAYLDARPAGRIALIAGGGAAVDVLRDLDGVHGLGEVLCHDLALTTMSLTARVLGAILGLAVASSPAEMTEAWGTAGRCVLDARQLLDEDDRLRPGEALPHRWSVTSDSIAARIARLIGASELVLVKSVDPPSRSLAALADVGYVDRHLPTLVEAVPRVAALGLPPGRSPGYRLVPLPLTR